MTTPTKEQASAGVAPDWKQLVYELCNRHVCSGGRVTPAIESCFDLSTGDRNKYPAPLDSLARAALAPVAPAEERKPLSDEQIETVLDAADEWQRFVDEDHAPMNLRKYLSRALGIKGD